MPDTRDHLAVVISHLAGRLLGDLPPSFRSPEMGPLLESLGHLTTPGEVHRAATFGLAVAALLTAQLQESMRAERTATGILAQRRLQ